MSSVMYKSPLTTCIFFYLTLLDVKCHVHDATLPHINKNTYLMVVDAMDHVWLPFVFGSTTKRTSWKTWPRWLARDDEDEKKEAWVGKRSGITFFSKNKRFEMQNSYDPKKRTSPSCKYQRILMLQMKWKLWKCCETQVFWKIADGPMCESPRVAIGARTLWIGKCWPTSTCWL